MKKIFMAFGAALLVAACSCNKSEKAADNQAEATDQAEVVETVVEEVEAPVNAIDVVAPLLDNDSTVTTTPSGLRYKIVKQTRGVTPTPTSTVKVNYIGMHTDGTIFDQSNGNPVVFPLTQVIPGFSEGISLMPTGSTYAFYMPAEIAYGERGAGNVIAPNEPLIFFVELVDIVEM